MIEALERERRPDDSVEAAFARLARREFDRAVKVPGDFVSEMQSHFSASYQTWTEARPANDFARVRPGLEKTLDLSRRYANFFPRLRERRRSVH
jgi:carboxypeptidase Taq